MAEPMPARALPFRLGATSYVLHEGIEPNVRYLAGQVRDVELVLFAVDERYPLPEPEVFERLSELAGRADLTYTVHLPLDLRLGGEGAVRETSLAKARRVIEATRCLNPWAYVVHLVAEAADRADTARLARWQARAIRSLEALGGWAGGLERLAIENLEGGPPDLNYPILERIGVSRCLDLGHLWLDGVPVMPHLDALFERTRVMHLHGVDRRDHSSLSHVPEAELDAVLRRLVADYRGVATLEVFLEADFLSSMAAVQAGLRRLEGLEDISKPRLD